MPIMGEPCDLTLTLTLTLTLGSYDEPVPPDMPIVGEPCDTEVNPECGVGFDDSHFEAVSLPHDFVVPGGL